MSGTVFGIGVGPGDPCLLTLRAAEVLAGVTFLVAPVSRSGADSVALGIAREHLAPGCEVREVVFPMSEEARVRHAAADEAAGLLADAARSERSAAFVTLGDAMLYSTWGYVLRALAEGHPDVAVETVPGVTAMSACAARLGRPLAEGRDALLVWPATPPGDLAPLLATAPNLVALKAGRHLARLAAAAEAASADLVAMRRCGMPGECVVRDASDIGEDAPEYFTTAFVKKERR